MQPPLNPQARLTLITGPARSGKTRLALELAHRFPEPRAYVATAEGLDSEMIDRIHRHRLERGSAFQTIEEPLFLGRALIQGAERFSVIVIDCLTLWISNLLGKWEGQETLISREISDLHLSLRNSSAALLLISNEVGWGIVPDNELARRFRDLSGRINQDIAQSADQVILTVAGLPLVLKQTAQIGRKV